MTRPHTRDRQLPVSKDLPKVPLLGLVSSSLTEVGLSKMVMTAQPDPAHPKGWRISRCCTAPDCGVEGTLAHKHGVKPRRVSRYHTRERVWGSHMFWGHLC